MPEAGGLSARNLPSSWVDGVDEHVAHKQAPREVGTRLGLHGTKARAGHEFGIQCHAANYASSAGPPIATWPTQVGNRPSLQRSSLAAWRRCERESPSKAQLTPHLRHATCRHGQSSLSGPLPLRSCLFPRAMYLLRIHQLALKPAMNSFAFSSAALALAPSRSRNFATARSRVLRAFSQAAVFSSSRADCFLSDTVLPTSCCCVIDDGGGIGGGCGGGSVAVVVEYARDG